MASKKILVSGSSGLVGSETVKFFAELGWEVYGIDIDMRGKMLGSEASTTNTGAELIKKYPNFKLFHIDIRDYDGLKDFFIEFGPFDKISHTAAQCSHEFSTNNALLDFSLNGNGTVNVLEAYRQYSPEAIFIHYSSSKVYGDSVNTLPLIELETRYDLPIDHRYYNGVDEEFGRLDGELHSLFGASKACGDIMAKEYATYFNLPIAIFRPVCISGSGHRSSESHGYLAYLIKCVAEGIPYTINDPKGKIVRDNIHAYDLVTAGYEVYLNGVKKWGEAYNLGAGRLSNNSIIEAFAQAEEILGKKANYTFSDKRRRGDHIWCLYDTTKFKTDFPNWKITFTNDKLMNEIASQYL